VVVAVLWVLPAYLPVAGAGAVQCGVGAVAIGAVV